MIESASRAGKYTERVHSVRAVQGLTDLHSALSPYLIKESSRHQYPATLQSRMKQATTKRVPNRGSWQPGQSGNVRGRPRTGLAFAEAVRERIDPHVVLDLVVRLLEDEATPIAQRLASALPFVHAGFVKPPTGLDVSVSKSTDEAAYSHLTDDQIRELLAAHDRVLTSADGHPMATRAHDDEKPEQAPVVALTTDA